ncbi:hypothetical protein GJAV_G00139700 [Gymnothorax javanicus]|nr:hypothetical protein GJAV_G00139700 [Gymnothorax javanicus]
MTTLETNQGTARVRGLREWLEVIRQIQTERKGGKFEVVGVRAVRAANLRFCRRIISMSSSMVLGVESAVTSVWRMHDVLDESDEADCSPEAPDRFRKLRSSSSLSSLRASLRKRLPLRSIQAAAEDTPTWEETPTWESLEMQRKPGAAVRLSRRARNSIGSAYQKLQRMRTPREECLVATPGRTPECKENSLQRRTQTTSTPHNTAATVTPKRGPQRTPRSAAKRTPRASRTPKSGGSCQGVRTGGSRRQLVRMAALRSPFASPNTMSNRRKFDQDLECVSSGLRKLKSLSQAFDDVIGRDDRVWATQDSQRAEVSSHRMKPSDPPIRNPRASIRRRTQRIRETVGSWTSVALSSIH